MNLSVSPLPQEDFEDLNVTSLTETKSQRAPTSESIPCALSPEAPRVKWLLATVVSVFIGFIALALMKAITRNTS